jgi:rhamnogalacturonyl hydrolase YesR
MVNVLKHIKHLLMQKPFYPSHFSVLFYDLIRPPYSEAEDRSEYSSKDHMYENNSVHLEAAMQWLCYAQDVNNDGGVSAYYNLSSGWKASYPETTGYIIPTFLDYCNFTGQREFRNRALRMADWLVSIQLPVGAFQGGPVDIPPKPSVFNTGQIVQGLVRAYQETERDSYLTSARKAGDWLVSMQDVDGSWRNYAYNGIPHSYYTRVAWPLLELFNLTKEERYREGARENLRWALGNLADNAWFRHNGFDAKTNPFTHNIVYAVRGMLESGILLKEPQYIDPAINVAELLREKFECKNMLAGDFDKEWVGTRGYSCLTGNAQLSIVLMIVYGLKRDKKHLDTARKINYYLKSTQLLHSNNAGIRGGVKGSDPVWGKYMSYTFPNWAVKFFVDALLKEEKLYHGLD